MTDREVKVAYSGVPRCCFDSANFTADDEPGTKIARRHAPGDPDHGWFLDDDLA